MRAMSRTCSVMDFNHEILMTYERNEKRRLLTRSATTDFSILRKNKEKNAPVTEKDEGTNSSVATQSKSGSQHSMVSSFKSEENLSTQSQAIKSSSDTSVSSTLKSSGDCDDNPPEKPKDETASKQIMSSEDSSASSSKLEGDLTEQCLNTSSFVKANKENWWTIH